MSKNDLLPKRTSNPAFNPQFLNDETRVLDGEPMTVNGTINKTAISLALVVLAALFMWKLFSIGFYDMAMLLQGSSIIASIILAIVIIFNRKSSVIRYLVPLYALSEGALLGGISFIFEKNFPGILSTALEATMICFAVMLFLYKYNIIKVNEKFRSIILLSTITITGIYLINILLSFFGISVPFVNSISMDGIIFSVFVVIISALNLLLDFDFIDRAAQSYMPKHIEWYGAFGLMVTIIWLYIEILRLLAKSRSRR